MHRLVHVLRTPRRNSKANEGERNGMYVPMGVFYDLVGQVPFWHGMRLGHCEMVSPSQKA
jgi:hypothetical protein